MVHREEPASLVGQAIGVDLEGQPDLIQNPAISLKAAIWEWNKHGLNKFADRNYLRVIGNAINRGLPFSKYEPIDRETEQRLARRWIKKRDPEAAQRLVCANLRFVVKIANTYKSYGLRMADLVEEGKVLVPERRQPLP